jgi:hypothetical protein
MYDEKVDRATHAGLLPVAGTCAPRVLSWGAAAAERS